MNIKNALKEAFALLDSVEIKGRDNMKRQVIGIERIESVIMAIENAEQAEQDKQKEQEEKNGDEN